MGDWRRVNLPLVGFKPNPIVVRSDSQSGDVIQELVQRAEIHWIHLLGKFRVDVEAIFDDLRSHRQRGGRTGGHDETSQPESLAHSQGSPRGDVVLDNEASHLPYDDNTVELSMKAPMSVSKPTDLG